VNTVVAALVEVLKVITPQQQQQQQEQQQPPPTSVDDLHSAGKPAAESSH
jgi:hypothetical protein